MCGITGIAGFNDKQLVYSMTKALEHRGPDDYGYFLDNNIGLGNRRLSIIDLPKGKQPIHNQDRSIWITFNGEIFNFKELRKQLEEKGHKFYTNSDTEVIVHAYEVWPDFVNRLSGQFAFALYDGNKKKVILARDKLGVKPLYYCYLDGKLLFASEIKAILKHKELKREINYDALSDYLTFRYVPNNLSLIKNIYKLPAASMLTYHNSTIEVERYWDAKQNIQQGSEEYFIRKIRESLESSVKGQMIADVPIGVYLSGGIDSSVVTAIMSKFSPEPLKTFSVGFEVADNELSREINETKYAKMVADKYNTDHYEIIVSQDIIKILPKVINHLDNPIAFETAMPLYYLSKLSRNNVKVILTGDGGDELFLGYHRYYDMILRSKIRKFIPFKDFLSYNQNYSGPKIIKNIRYVLSDEPSSYLKGFTTFSEGEKKELLSQTALEKVKDISSVSAVSKSIISNMSIVSSMRYADMQHWLPDLVLTLGDNMSMANSIETRVPLLDENLVNLSFTIPGKILSNAGSREYTKPLFKKAVADLLPRELLGRKKHGFNVPMKAWQDNSFREIGAKITESYDAMEFFNKEYLSKLHSSLSSSQPGKSLRMIKMYSIVMFLLWKKLNIDDVKPGRLINSIE